MYPHRMRLHGPWQCQPLSPDGEPSRIRVPCRWSDANLGEFPGCVRFTRRFGYPGRIDEYERVWLTLADWQGIADISVNEQSLAEELSPSNCPVEFDVTALLEQRNTLQIDLSSESDDPGLTGEIALEIRCSAYLKNVTANRNGNEIVVAGELVGTCDRPLELYLLCNDNHAGYKELTTSAEGRIFEFTVENAATPSDSPVSIRLELVNVSTVWYAVELSV